MCPSGRPTTQWTQFEDFPQFMEAVEDVRQIDDTHLRWKVESGGTRHEWEAEITEQRPDERIAWTSRSGKGNSGVVTFHRLDEDTTRIMVQLEWEPEGAKEQAGSALGFDDRSVKGDLERFKAADRGARRRKRRVARRGHLANAREAEPGTGSTRPA